MLLWARCWKLLETDSLALIDWQSVDDTVFRDSTRWGVVGWLCRVALRSRDYQGCGLLCYRVSLRGFFFNEVQRRILRKSWWVLSELLVVWRGTRWTMERSAQNIGKSPSHCKQGKSEAKSRRQKACHWAISVSIWPVLLSMTANQILFWAGLHPCN